MGQEIAYCALCGCQLRSVDFEKGGAFRVDLQSYCKKCAPEAVKSLPPEKIQAILKQGIAPPSRPSKPVAEGEGPSPSSRAIRISPRKSGPQQSLIVATASVGLGAVVLLLFLVFSGRPSPEPEASRSLPARPPVEPAPVAIKPPEPRPIAGGSSPAEQVGKKPAEPVVAPLPREAPEPAPVAPNPAESPKPAEPPKAPLPEPRPPEPAPVEPATSPAAASKRPGVPAAAKLREAEAAYQKTFRPDLVKAPADKAKLARTLLSSAASSGAKDAELYVLLREARDLAAAGMDPATALEAIEAKAGAFDVNPVADTLDLFTKSTAKGAAAATWGGLCIEAAERMADADDFEAALRLAARAEAFGRAANDRSLEGTAKERGRELADLKRVADGLRSHFKTLESKPEDPAANAAVGKFICLVKGDWKRGLPMLARSLDPAWKSLAEQELAKPTEAAAEAALGEAWTATAEKETPTYKARARARAAEWLGRAIPRLTGLAKVAAEKTLAGLGPIPASKERLSLDLGAGVKLDLVSIKPGTFTMGGTMASTIDWQVDERPEHRVTLTRGYLLGKYEVTRGQFAQFAKASGYKTDAEREGKTYGRPAGGGWAEIPGMSWQQLPFPQTDEHPAGCISWNDAKAFCDWAAKKTGRGVRLPTEAEWEYACRAGTRTKFASGDDESAMMEWAWTASNTGETTRPVGQKKPNAWGLFDMHGNVWEWCQDWAGPYSGDIVDPTGPSGSDRRMLRGGSCNNPNIDCRSSFRLRFYPVDRSAQFGFRVAVN